MIKHITTTPAKALEKLKAGNASILMPRSTARTFRRQREQIPWLTVRSLMRLLLLALIPA